MLCAVYLKHLNVFGPQGFEFILLGDKKKKAKDIWVTFNEIILILFSNITVLVWQDFLSLLS